MGVSHFSRFREVARRTADTDQNRKTTTYTYDDADRLTAVTDPAPGAHPPRKWGL
jgi:YD repeat-containing protein